LLVRGDRSLVPVKLLFVGSDRMPGLTVRCSWSPDRSAGGAALLGVAVVWAGNVRAVGIASVAGMVRTLIAHWNGAAGR
jgi:hypothetical protein